MRKFLIWFSVVTSFIAALFILGLMGLGLWLVFWLIVWALSHKRKPKEISSEERQRRAQADLSGIDRANKRRQEVERLKAEVARRKAEKRDR